MKTPSQRIISSLCVNTETKHSVDTTIINIDNDIELLSNISILSRNNYQNSKAGIGKRKFIITKKDKPFIKNGYNDHFHFYFNGCYFLVSYNPRTHYLPYARLVINLDEFDSMLSVKKAFEDIWNEKISDYLFYLATIKRIDFCVDLKINFADIERTLYRPNIRWVKEECSNLESVTLGVLLQSSLQHIVYEKTSTRIEARYTGKYCPINHLADLTTLIKFNPFERLHLFDFNIKKIDLSKYRTKTSNAISVFAKDYLYHGFHKARKRSNKTRNFSKTLMPKLSHGIIEYDICTAWRRNHGSFCSSFMNINNSAVKRAGKRYQLKKEIMSQKQLLPVTVLKTSQIYIQ